MTVLAKKTNPAAPKKSPNVRSGKAKPPIRPFRQSLPMQLMRARELVMQRFRPHLYAHGLTDQQWRIIRALAEVKSLEIMALGAKCCIHPASLSRTLPKMDAAGILQRRTNEKDQRRMIISLTAKGRRLFERVSPESEPIYLGLTRDVGAARLKEAYRVLDEIIEILSAPSTTSA